MIPFLEPFCFWFSIKVELPYRMYSQVFYFLTFGKGWACIDRYILSYI